MVQHQNTTQFDNPYLYTKVITPPSGWHLINIHELWLYRDLLFHLVWRNIKVQYKQTILGAFWVLLQPFITMVVFTVIFGNFAKIPSNGIPYPLFSFAALVPWMFFSSGISNVAQSIVSNTGMLKKVYFPRLIFPLSVLLSSLVDFIPSFVMLVGMVVFYSIFQSLSVGEPPIHIYLSLNIVWIIPFMVLAFITALGFGLWLAALNVQFRDVRYATGFLVRIWLYLTPVIYPASMVDENLKFLYYMNPMVAVIEGFRWSVLNVATHIGLEMLISTIVATVVLFSGLIYFNRMEKWFADVA